MVTQKRGGQLRIHICSDCGEAEICDPRLAGGIYKDVLLVYVNTAVKLESEITTHSFEVTMDHIARVKVAETLDDARQLTTGVSV